MSRKNPARANRRRTAWLLAVALAAASPAHADRRSYVWSYEYQTKPPGGVDLEHYLTSKTSSTKAAVQTAWEQKIELEIGLTERWDFSVYQIFSQPPGGSFQYDAFQFRTRYRLGQAGQWPVDPLLYVEYHRPSDLGRPNRFEGKLILAHDIRRVNLVANLIEEVNFAPGVEWKTGYTAGISFEPRPIVKFGVEVYGGLATQGGKTHNLGPTISLARDKWYYTIGVGFGLNKASNDIEARAILGIDL